MTKHWKSGHHLRTFCVETTMDFNESQCCLNSEYSSACIRARNFCKAGPVMGADLDKKRWIEITKLFLSELKKYGKAKLFSY